MKLQYLVLFVLFVNACSSSPSDKSENKKEFTLKKNVKNEEITKDSLLNNITPIWKVEMLGNGEEVLVKGDSINFIKDDYRQLIIALNKNNKVQIEFQKIRGDCIYVEIINSTYFTQSIGDTGADWYLVSLVYTLTESKKFNYVFVKFKEGDHGGLPGKKSRNSFNYRIQ